MNNSLTPTLPQTSRRTFLLAALAAGSAIVPTPQARATGLADTLTPFKRLTGQAGTLRIGLIDGSKTVPDQDRALYREASQRFFATAQPGDRLLLASVADAGMDRFLAQSFTLGKTGRSFDDRKLKTETLSKVNAAIQAMTSTPGKGALSRIVETLAALRPEVEAALGQGMRVQLLLNSDAMEDSPLASFEGKRLTDDLSNKLLQKLSRDKLLLALPRKEGVPADLQVSIVGSGGASADSYQRIERFWRAYVTTACGGQLVYYGRTTPNFS